MISIRRSFIVFILLIIPPAMAFEAYSGGIDPPPVRPADQNMNRPSPVGVQEVSRPDGERDVIYYSVTPAEEKQARQQAEIHKQEKSLELLNNAIIIKR